MHWCTYSDLCTGLYAMSWRRPLNKVKTTRFGEIEVDENETIELPHGLIGFPELKRFVLLDHDKDSPFKWLQSLEDGGIAFVLINPLLFKPDYSIEVTQAEVSDLDLKKEEDAVICAIITMPSNPKNMTANLKAPLIFNLQNRTGKQVILNTSQYNTRHNILDEMDKYKNSQHAQQVKEAIEKAKASRDNASTTEESVSK